jgi:hypothetical protein
MTTITRDEIESKRKKHLKYFDYAEIPIKKWISSYLDKQCKDVFDDYNEDIYDVILFKYKNKQWCVEYELEEFNHPIMFESEFWKEEKCEKLDESIKILLEAMSFVYYSVVNTIPNNNYKKIMENIVPKFDVSTLSFYFNGISLYKIQYENIFSRFNIISERKKYLIEMLNKKDINENDKIKINEEIKNINEEIKKVFNELNKYDKNEIEKKDIEINEFNKNISNKKRLYIHVYEIEEIEEELKFKRLPEIDTPFKFDDEESLSEQLKKL